MLHPLVYIATTSSLTLLLICIGLLGDAGLAADLAVAQGAVLATFYAFSANARNLILQRDPKTGPDELILARIVFMLPLCALAYFLSAGVAAVPPLLAGAVILRRACEWLGEIHLSALEREGARPGAAAYLAVQTIALAGLGIILVVQPSLFLPALWLWAVLPLAGATQRLARLSGASLGRLLPTLRALVPHAGSTLITGISIYLLRVIIVLVTDREFAGLLFTAVAIGSVSGALFVNVLGPSLALRDGARRRQRLLAVAPVAFVVGGAALALASTWLAGLPFGKPAFFWQATGLSLVGSAVMIEAGRIRLRLFESSRGDELFGPDVLRTLTLMLVTPAMAAVFGRHLLAGVYLLDAVLTWMFYLSAYKHATASAWLSQRTERWLELALGVLLVFPLFVQLQGRVYHSPDVPMLDSAGRVLNLPLPLSLAACFAGTLLLARFRQAALAMGVIFFLFVGMVLTSVAATEGTIDYESRKLLLLLQFLLPAFALILGQMFAHAPDSERILPRAFLYTLGGFVPLQLLLTWIQGQHVLTHNMLLFSIYQHRQYVPVVFVSAYLVALFSLWRVADERRLLIGLALLMGVYAAISYSTLALGLLVIGAALLAISRGAVKGIIVVAALTAVVAATLWQLRDTFEFKEKYIPSEVQAGQAGAQTGIPTNVSGRIRDWTMYGRGILQSGRTLLFGHAEALDRSVSTSAHNYYLDFLYNFGLIALLPLLALISYTVRLVWRDRALIASEPGLLGLAFVVLFLIFVDNNFKVNLRQPYPGAFTFFLWGLLLSRLRLRA